MLKKDSVAYQHWQRRQRLVADLVVRSGLGLHLCGNDQEALNVRYRRGPGPRRRGGL